MWLLKNYPLRMDLQSCGKLRNEWYFYNTKVAIKSERVVCVSITRLCCVNRRTQHDNSTLLNMQTQFHKMLPAPHGFAILRQTLETKLYFYNTKVAIKSKKVVMCIDYRSTSKLNFAIDNCPLNIGIYQFPD